MPCYGRKEEFILSTPSKVLGRWICEGTTRLSCQHQYFFKWCETCDLTWPRLQPIDKPRTLRRISLAIGEGVDWWEDPTVSIGRCRPRHSKEVNNGIPECLQSSLRTKKDLRVTERKMDRLAQRTKIYLQRLDQCFSNSGLVHYTTFTRTGKGWRTHHGACCVA